MLRTWSFGNSTQPNDGQKIAKKRVGGGAGNPALPSHLYLVQVAPDLVSRAVTEDEALERLSETGHVQQTVLYKRTRIFFMGHHEAWGHQTNLEPMLRQKMIDYGVDKAILHYWSRLAQVQDEQRAGFDLGPSRKSKAQVNHS